MRDFKTEPLPCPYCGLPSDVQSNTIDDTPPEPGALLICILCACPAFLREDGELQRLTTDELTHVYKSRHVVAAILSVIAASRATDVGDPTPLLRYVPKGEA